MVVRSCYCSRAVMSLPVYREAAVATEIAYHHQCVRAEQMNNAQKDGI